jgi:hypothetical protein
MSGGRGLETDKIIKEKVGKQIPFYFSDLDYYTIEINEDSITFFKLTNIGYKILARQKFGRKYKEFKTKR